MKQFLLTFSVMMLTVAKLFAGPITGGSTVTTVTNASQLAHTWVARGAPIVITSNTNTVVIPLPSNITNSIFGLKLHGQMCYGGDTTLFEPRFYMLSATQTTNIYMHASYWGNYTVAGTAISGAGISSASMGGFWGLVAGQVKARMSAYDPHYLNIELYKLATPGTNVFTVKTEYCDAVGSGSQSTMMGTFNLGTNIPTQLIYYQSASFFGSNTTFLVETLEP